MLKRTVASLLLLCLPAAAFAAEWVTVVKATDDGAIVSRSDGSTHLIEVGTGCLSLYRREGKRVLVDSPGMFLGIGSKLVLPDDDQSCRVWNSEMLGYGDAQAAGDSAPVPSNDCESGHWIRNVSDGGEIITLEDGSVWEVDSIDRIHTTLWLPVTDVTVCGSKLINSDDGESVEATRLR